MIGETIGHYRIIERLGRGGMGEVFLAEDLRLHRQAAVKIIADDLARNEMRRLRFFQEARLAASVDHPNLAAIYDIDQDGDRTFIAMEYVQGRSLRQVLSSGPLEPKRAVQLALQMADALAKVHEHGVIHRDLKPENVMVAHDGYAKIIDFGLAKLVAPLGETLGPQASTTIHPAVQTADGAMLGTVDYMSPEQARGQPIDARSDVFSFGAVLYEMLTGLPSFRRQTPVDTIGAILGADPPAVRVGDPAAGPALASIVRRCLEKDPARRYQSMRDVEVDLRAATAVTGESAAPRLGRTSVPIRALAIAAVVLLFGLAAAVFWPRPGAPAAASPRPSSAPLSASPAVGPRPTVAIMPFTPPSGSTDLIWLAKGMPAMIATSLSQTTAIALVGADRLIEAAHDEGRDSLEAVDADRLAAVAGRAGASVLVVGGVIQVGGDLTVDMRVLDRATGKSLGAETARGRNPLDLADELASRLRADLGAQASGPVRRVADVSSTSLDAFRSYVQGLDALSAGKPGDARKPLERALVADSSFALAALTLAIASEADGHADVAKKWLATATSRLDRLSERDALEARARLSLLDGRFDEARTVNDMLLARYPEDESAYVRAGWLFDAAAGPLPSASQAVEVLTRGEKALPASPVVHILLGTALTASGRYDDGQREFETAAHMRPRDGAALAAQGDAWLASGDPVKAADAYRRAIDQGVDAARSGLAWADATLGKYDEALDAERGRTFTRAFLLSRVGRYRDADAIVQSGLKRAERDKDEEWAAAFAALHAATALERQDCEAARADAAAIAAAATNLPPPFARRWQSVGDLLAGACEARAGRLDAARSRAARLAAGPPPVLAAERWWRAALDGEIALASNDGEAATRAFAGGEPAGRMPVSSAGIGWPLSILANSLALRDGRARARALLGPPQAAVDAYRALASPARAVTWTAALEPRHVLALARLLERLGQKDAARAEYRRFLDLWAHADPDLPELGEARAGAAR